MKGSPAGKETRCNEASISSTDSLFLMTLKTRKSSCRITFISKYDWWLSIDDDVVGGGGGKRVNLFKSFLSSLQRFSFFSSYSKSLILPLPSSSCYHLLILECSRILLKQCNHLKTRRVSHIEWQESWRRDDESDNKKEMQRIKEIKREMNIVLGNRILPFQDHITVLFKLLSNRNE